MNQLDSKKRPQGKWEGLKIGVLKWRGYYIHGKKLWDWVYYHTSPRPFLKKYYIRIK
jgi:hypothetical protein